MVSLTDIIKPSSMLFHTAMRVRILLGLACLALASAIAAAGCAYTVISEDSPN